MRDEETLAPSRGEGWVRGNRLRRENPPQPRPDVGDFFEADGMLHRIVVPLDAVAEAPQTSFKRFNKAERSLPERDREEPHPIDPPCQLLRSGRTSVVKILTLGNPA